MSEENVSQKINELKERKQHATSREELEQLLQEARLLVRNAMDSEFHQAAMELFREIRDKSDAVSSSGGIAGKPDWQERIQTERERLETGNIEEIYTGIEGLGQVLRALGNDPESKSLTSAFEALEYASRNPQARSRLLETLEASDIPRTDSRQRLVDKLRTSPPPPPPVPVKDEGIHDDDLMTRALRLFYAGDYLDAINLFSEILNRDPNNRDAQTRLKIAEDNISRGYVPDNRVPFDARLAFGRAQSLERAGRFLEARDKYKEALEEARKGGIQNWEPAMNALLGVEQSLVALETREEADRLMREDRWKEAIEKFESVLKLIPEEPHATENLNLLRLAQERYQVARVQLGTMSGNLSEMANMIFELQKTIRELRPKMPESKNLTTMEAEIQSKGRLLKNRLVENGRRMLDQANNSVAISEQLRSVRESRRLLDDALLLDSSDAEAFDLTQQASEEESKLTNVEKVLIDVKKLIDKNLDEERKQAAVLLREYREYNQDPRYKQYLATLHRQYLEQAETYLAENKPHLAKPWINGAKQDPFRLLGRSAELGELERLMESEQRKPIIKVIGFGGLALLVFLILGGLTQNFWRPLLFPEPTLVPTVTPTLPATETLMPTLTPTLTLTPTPTNTPEPSPTPFRVGAVTNPGSDVVTLSVRYLSSFNSSQAFVVTVGDVVFILDEIRDVDGRLWYFIRYINRDGVAVEGWILGRYINVQPTITP